MNICDKCNDTGMVNSMFEGIELMIPCWKCLSDMSVDFTNEDFNLFLNEIRSEFNA